MALQTQDFSVTAKSSGGGITYTYILRVTENSTNASSNTSNVTVQAILKQSYSGTAFHTWYTGVSCTINGIERFSDYRQRTLSGTSEHVYYEWTGDIAHNDDGAMDLSVTGKFWQSLPAESYSPPSMTIPTGTFSLTQIQTYYLSVSEGSGSSVSVNRTYSGYAGTGNITSGARLYYGDNLKISFSPNTNYRLLTTTVNGSNFTSGNTYTVTSDVNIVSTAQPLSSSVGATDANIESVSTITITKYNDDYYHSLQYSFGSLHGYITSSGSVSDEEYRFKGTSVAFSIPTSFYEQIPNDPSGECIITCNTYETSSSTTQLGESKSCSIAITASEALCKPTVSGVVVDINENTNELTGDDSVLIRYKSTAQCTISADANNHAKISETYINGVAPKDNVRTIYGVSEPQFIFSARDSRGYPNSYTVNPIIIPYIELSCNPIISRPNPTSNKIIMTVSGNFYRGSFGKHTNTLKLQYRYKESGGSYGDWNTVDSTLITYGTSSYKSTSEIELTSYSTIDENGDTINNGFDYRVDYDFHIKATDGYGDYTLSTVNKYVTVSRGMPVFDWGENDFNFNVPVSILGVQIADFIVEQGTSDIWVYRKWNSGIAECWTSQQFDVEVSDTWGGLYTTGAISGSNIAYPFTFTSKPMLNTSLASYDYGAILMIPGGASESNVESNSEQTGCFEIARGTQAQASKYTINYYAIGRYK